jgi:hypothetical protein
MQTQRGPRTQQGQWRERSEQGVNEPVIAVAQCANRHGPVGRWIFLGRIPYVKLRGTASRLIRPAFERPKRGAAP